MADIPHALTIAGSDPSGGAGIQADLKTFHAFAAFGMAVVTSLTAQNTRGVTGIHDVPAAFVGEQIETLLSDCRVDAAKTGMLKSAEIIERVAGSLGTRLAGRLVVDPVMVATSGDRLIEDDAVEAMRRALFPRAAIVTPNPEETEVLAGVKPATAAEARSAAVRILESGTGAVLVKGIRDEDDVVDLLVTEGGERAFRRPWLPVGETHGTGCTLSAAIAAGLAFGHDLEDAVEAAGDYVWRAIREARPVGGGGLPLNHLVRPSGGTA